MIKFAEKEGVVDYKFLLESYKDRTKRIDSHPLRASKKNCETEYWLYNI